MATTHDATPRRLTSEDVWRTVTRASFAVVSYATPSGDPRSSGVVYKTIGQRLYIVTAPDSWKARHIAVSGRVSVTVPVRRGGVLSLLVPIPPATVSFHGAAVVHQPGSPESRSVTPRLGSLVPPERRASAAIVEVTPEDAYVTYGVGVPLSRMRDPAQAGARVPVRRLGPAIDG